MLQYNAIVATERAGYVLYRALVLNSVFNASTVSQLIELESSLH